MQYVLGRDLLLNKLSFRSALLRKIRLMSKRVSISNDTYTLFTSYGIEYAY